MEDPIVPGTPGEGKSDVTPTPTDGGYQMPEKFSGKSAEDIAKAYSELEKTLGKKESSVDYNKIAELMDEKFNNLRPKEAPTDEDKQNQINKDYAKSIGLATIDDVRSAEEQGYKKAMVTLLEKELSTKYDGKDGRPAFNPEATKDFVRQNPWLREAHPEVVYKHMNEKALDDWKIAQALKGNRAPMIPKGGPKPAPGTPDTSKMTPEQRKAHLVAALEAGQYE